MGSRSKNKMTQEVQLLQSIKKTYKEKKWKLISKNLAKKGFQRSEHQCRHKWVNCLNPDINHGTWSDEQLRILYTEYEKNNSQWSLIQKALPNRTQIRIKNHFYGILRNIMRFISKYFKCILNKESQLSNKINPNSLQQIYRGEKEFSFLENHVKNAIYQMGFHFIKQKFLKIVQKNRNIYQQLNFKLFEQKSDEGKRVKSEQEFSQEILHNKSTSTPIYDQKIRIKSSTYNSFKQQEFCSSSIPQKNQNSNTNTNTYSNLFYLQNSLAVIYLIPSQPLDWLQNQNYGYSPNNIGLGFSFYT